MNIKKSDFFAHEGGGWIVPEPDALAKQDEV